ncbi:MAG: hypothetical protein U0412_09855 [Nitrospira sp.]
MPALTRDEFGHLLPHGGAMRLLDTVEAWNDTTIRCRAVTHRDPRNPLRARGRLAVSAGLEYAAQAMGIHIGLVEGGHPASRIGYVGGVRDVTFSVERLDDEPDDLVIDATRLAEGDQSYMYQFRVALGDRPVIEGRASLFLKPVMT